MNLYWKFIYLGLIVLYYLTLPIYILLFLFHFIKYVCSWFYFSIWCKTLFGVEITMYIPQTVTWKSYYWILAQTPQFFASLRFYKIWIFKKNSTSNWFLKLILNCAIFICDLPINVFQVVGFWYTMFFVLTYDFENFKTHYINLQNEFFNNANR